VKLYTYFRSSAAFRVRIALNLKGLPYEASFVSLPKGEHRTGQFAALNRQALLPSLEDGGARLNQSLSIIEYLEERHPDPALLPKDAQGRARVRSLSLLVACEIHPLNNLRTLQYLRRQVGQNEEQIKTWYQHWIDDGLVKLEDELREAKETGRFCHGDSPTMADCCLVPQIFNAKRYDSDLAPYPTTMSVFDQCMKLDAFERAQPSKQPDAE
jgi:maleylacetoacetate isomerase/maleylpyruvate isomerase